jgi:peptidoglycan/xylan/chitin deacetylase (PgdA/CDA1 family)
MTTRHALAALVAVLLAGCGTVGTNTQPSATPLPSSTSTATTPPPTQPGSATPRPPQSATPTASHTPTTTLPAWLRGHVVTALPTSKRVVALTFDGGAGAQGAASILATLARTGVQATFFFTGDFVTANPATVRAVAAAGHVIGDHTVTHPHATALSSASLAEQVNEAAARISAVTGRSPKPWFRFPYGEYDTRTLGVVNGLGYGAIGWTIDTKGWLGTQAGTAAQIPGRVLAALRPGAIVLMHVGANPDDHTTFDADALAGVIAAVRAAGYTFVTVANA